MPACASPPLLRRIQIPAAAPPNDGPGLQLVAEPGSGPDEAHPALDPQVPESRLVIRTRERHAAVAEPRARGYSLNAVSRELGLSFRTVHRFARAAIPDELLLAALNRASNLDRFKPYLHQRWNDGCADAAALHTDPTALGWRGGLRSVQRYARSLRTGVRTPDPRPALPTPRRITRWIMTDPDHRSPGEQVQLKEILARCPELDAVSRHVNAFAKMMCGLHGEQLPAWMDAIRADDLPELHSLVTSFGRDQRAVA